MHIDYLYNLARALIDLPFAAIFILILILLSRSHLCLPVPIRTDDRLERLVSILLAYKLLLAFLFLLKEGLLALCRVAAVFAAAALLLVIGIIRIGWGKGGEAILIILGHIFLLCLYYVCDLREMWVLFNSFNYII